MTAALGGLLLGVLGTWLWAWQRQKAQERRLTQLDAARQQLSQQNTAARRQIEQLQKELSGMRLADERAHHRVVHHEPLPQSLDSVTPELLPEDEPEHPADGFAPTQLLNRG
ncbi:MAG TPA: hypothetical protein VK195_10575 [Burkholderiaceae bacterium]|nr:hypothetical protein [Burkholderiaceae bacterium]